MVLIRIAHAVITAELLVRLVIGIQAVPATPGNPFGRGLDTEVVVLILRQTALSVGTFQYALCQRHGGRNAVSPHLFHRIVCVLSCIFLILVCHISTSSWLDVVRSRSLRRLFLQARFAVP